MLHTPLGNVVIQKNGINMNYKAIPQPLKVIDKCNYYVDARYLLVVDTATIKSGDIIQCSIECKNIETDIDGGECLSLLNFRKDNILMSLGAYEVLYHYDDNKSFAFDICYIKNGLEAYFIDTQFVDKFKLAISWMKLHGERDEVSTWYASDPMLCDK